MTANAPVVQTIPQTTPENIPKPLELREGAQVELYSRLSCTVAFARGQERHVLFDIKGLPQQPGRGAVHDADEMEGLSGPPPTAAEIAAAAPVVVVADPGRPLASQGSGVAYSGPGRCGCGWLGGCEESGGECEESVGECEERERL